MREQDRGRKRRERAHRQMIGSFYKIGLKISTC